MVERFTVRLNPLKLRARLISDMELYFEIFIKVVWVRNVRSTINLLKHNSGTTFFEEYWWSMGKKSIWLPCEGLSVLNLWGAQKWLPLFASLPSAGLDPSLFTFTNGPSAHPPASGRVGPRMVRTGSHKRGLSGQMECVWDVSSAHENATFKLAHAERCFPKISTLHWWLVRDAACDVGQGGLMEVLYAYEFRLSRHAVSIHQ